MNQKKVLISGSYGTGNVGDEIILEAILSLLEDYDVTVMSHNPKYTEKYFNVKATTCPNAYSLKRFVGALIKGRFHQIKETIGFIKSLINCDIFIMGGGGLLVGMLDSVLFYYLTQLRWAKFLKKRIIIFAIGVTSISNDRQKDMLRKTLGSGISLISVRDTHSLRILNANSISSFLIPDHAFNLKFEKQESIKKRIGLCLYHALSDPKIWPQGSEIFGIFEERIIKFIRHYQNLGYDIFLIPFGDSGDLKYNISFQNNYNENNPTSISLIKENSYQKILSSLGECEYTLTMRFHAGLTSLMMNIPSLCVDFQFKSQRLLEDMRLDDELLISIGDNINKKYERENYDLIAKMDLIINNKKEILEKAREYTQAQEKIYNEFIQKEFYTRI